MPKLLAIDDDRTVLRLVKKAFEGSGVELIAVSTAEDGLPLIRSGEVDVCLLDIMLPEMSGMELARKIHVIDAQLPVIFMTSLDDSATAIEAMKLGAYDYCSKPLDIQQVQDLVERALEARRLMRSPVTLPQSGGETVSHGDQLIGNSAEMLEVYKQIGRVAHQQVPVLLRGESGTGKELIARAIYQHSHRKEKCYLAVNCAALSETLLESELFGHEKGAFTGAETRHIGKFEQCRGGTIFLDEIGDMSPLLQSKILRLLQEQTFERVGGSETITSDARIVSATNRDLETMIEDYEFRLDLYHRIKGFEIVIPPLRERSGDIDLLVQYFLRRFSRELNKPIEGLSNEVMNRLRRYPWPGNVRELQGVLRRAILMASGNVIVPENLTEELIRKTSGTELPDSPQESADLTESQIVEFVQALLDEGSNDIYAETLQMMERQLITRVLQETGGNQSRAAELLGITRGSLRTKLRALDLVIEQVVSSARQ